MVGLQKAMQVFKLLRDFSMEVITKLLKSHS